MRLPTTQRREIIEDILDIKVFSTMNLLLRDKVRENNDEVKNVDYELDLLKDKIDLQKQHMLTLEKRTQDEIDRKKEKIEEYKKNESKANNDIELLTVEIGNLNEEMQEYQKSNAKIKKLTLIS